jgi:ankyrin repeat protein
MITLNSLSFSGKTQATPAQRANRQPNGARPALKHDVFFSGDHSDQEKKTHQTTLVLDEKGLNYKPKASTKTFLQKQWDKMVANGVKGAQLDQPMGRYGKPILHEAAYEGDTKVAQEALEHGADVNGNDNQGFTPLHWAVKAKQNEMILLLLDHRAGLDFKNFYGNKPFDYEEPASGRNP